MMHTHVAAPGVRARSEFGDYLRAERELRRVGLADLSHATKIPLRVLERLEAGEWHALPAVVFIRGFVRAYGRELGIEGEADDHFTQALALVRRDEEAQTEAVGDAAAAVGTRRRFGLALFVIILLIIATITLSALWGVGSDASTRATLERCPAPGVQQSRA
jgi:cytoskeleton protein RodZ